jgi:pyruvate dehydrogenase E2 component (dihydrolipoamide acetyltransferase)
LRWFLISSDFNMAHEFRLPDLGEGLTEAVLVDWRVKEGEVVQPNQPIAEVETDKASTPLPAPVSGKVSKLHWKPGDTIPVGSVLITFDALASATTPPPPAPVKPLAAPSPRAGVASALESRTAASVPARVGAAEAESGRRPVLAAPATRRMAREHGIDIRQVRGTGPGGRVTPEDVLAFVSSPARRRGGAEAAVEIPAPSEGGLTLQRPMLPDFSIWGQVERQKASAIRRRIAQRMALSTQITAAVTHMDEADITLIEQHRQQAQKRAEAKGVKLTLLPFVIKAIVAALQRFPIFNTSYDDDKQEIVYKKYFHIGVAADSPLGLLVPVVRDANKKTVLEIARDIVALAGKAREGKLAADEMRGGSFTITNIGSIGGTAFTPIINWPEVAILGLGRTQERPALRDGQLVNLKKLPLMLTFDHRVIDGAEGARFMNEVKQNLENPVLLMLES